MKLLILEFWGLGDLSFSTPMLRAAVEQHEVTIIGKPHAEKLLAPTFPQIRFISYDAPWTAYRDKYKLWRWQWLELLSTLSTLRAERFHAAVSVRNDPRDHLFMWLAGAEQRFGFPLKGSRVLLTDPLKRSRPRQHRVEDWRDIARAVELSAMDSGGAYLEHARYHSPRPDPAFALARKPIVGLHPGARMPVRRWPEEYFAEIVRKLREEFDFHLILLPDLDDYGSALRPLADSTFSPESVHELVDAVGRVDLLLCNDSGPCHIGTASGRPVIAIFGPGDVKWFAPDGPDNLLVARDICPWRPCFDYCHFDEPHCLTKLLPARVWPEIRDHIRKLISRGVLPPELRKVEHPAA